MGIFHLQDLLFLGICLGVHLVYRCRRKTRLPLPPGLPRWPIVGNALSIPTTSGHKFYKELGQRLGSKILYLEGFGQPIIVLNDAHMARDLLEKRSALYSSRPRAVMFSDVMKLGCFFALMPYGDEWRNHRRVFRQYFSPKTIKRNQETELEFVRKGLLPNLYHSRDGTHEHVQSCIGGISTAITYGLRIQRSHDPMVQLAEEAFSAGSDVAAPGKYLVEIIPALSRIPAWMPGANFKKFALKAQALLTRAIEEPFRETLKTIENGTAQVSFVSESLEQFRDRPGCELQALRIKQAASQVYGAASESTVAATMTFILAMLKYPDVQRKAQREVDFVVGTNRLPEFSDQHHLPYLSAILKEVLRWNPVAPLGLPHFTTDEDTYEGFYIPRGSIVIANAYAMLHDDDIFPNPEEFKPERFFKNGKISPDVPDPEVYATFGFGRRICPGSHIALSALYIAAASILAIFDISPELDVQGEPIDAVVDFRAGSLISPPMPFPCRITPRQAKNTGALLKEYLDTEVI